MVIYGDFFHSYVSLPEDTVDPISLKHGLPVASKLSRRVSWWLDDLDGLPHPGTARARACFLGHNLLRDQAPGCVTREKTHHKYKDRGPSDGNRQGLPNFAPSLALFLMLLPEGIWQLQVTFTISNGSERSPHWFSTPYSIYPLVMSK